MDKGARRYRPVRRAGAQPAGVEPDRPWVQNHPIPLARRQHPATRGTGPRPWRRAAHARGQSRRSEGYPEPGEQVEHVTHGHRHDNRADHPIHLHHRLACTNYNAAYGALQVGLEQIEAAYEFDAIDLDQLRTE